MKYLIHELCFRIVRVLQLSTTMIMFQDLDKGYYSMNMTMFLDCEDCGREYEGDCPIHGPSNHQGHQGEMLDRFVWFDPNCS